MKKIWNTLFIIAAILTMFEYYYICGMFTSLIMLIIIAILGIINMIYAAKGKLLNEALLYLLCTVALCLGYFKLMF
ncbi:MAG: hypothetical protein GX567_10995 [Clostridia bacterium]|nr:hypothetical protein [Clostridia bacterium]